RRDLHDERRSNLRPLQPELLRERRSVRGLLRPLSARPVPERGVRRDHRPRLLLLYADPELRRRDLSQQRGSDLHALRGLLFRVRRGSTRPPRAPRPPTPPARAALRSRAAPARSAPPARTRPAPIASGAITSPRAPATPAPAPARRANTRAPHAARRPTGSVPA